MTTFSQVTFTKCHQIANEMIYTAMNVDTELNGVMYYSLFWF